MFRLNGYLEFYLKTKNIRRAPFYILSAGNAVLMIVVMILHDYCDNQPHCKSTLTKVVPVIGWIDEGIDQLFVFQVDYLRGLITLESLVITCLVVNYMMWVVDFHKRQMPPDVLREDITSSIMLVGKFLNLFLSHLIKIEYFMI